MKPANILLFLLLASSLVPAQGRSSGPSVTGAPSQVVGTYSIVGWDSLTGDLGIAVQSKFLGVGAVVPFAKAGVGAIATQAFANTTYGPEGLRLLEQGLNPQFVIEGLTKPDSGASRRQVGIVDAQGNSFAYTGTGCQQYAGHITGRGYSVQGNILAGEGVIKAMARTFEMTTGTLAERLISALEAGEKAGGDKRGRQSAALLVVRDKGGYGGFNDRFIDIRVDDNPTPLPELRRLLSLWQQTFLLDAQMRSLDMFNQKKNFTASRQTIQDIANSVNALLREKPDDPDVLNSIAWTLASNEIDNVRALDLAKRAVRLKPDDLNFLDTLAECHFHLGHFDEAIAIESQLVAKDPANDGFWKQLQKFKERKSKEGR
ncbi:MAG TPA: DUF1028 domain-containing protein [Bacteroidota bacterium]|jgi:uncharacterized Ntn-hydrolase superfamily protein|nr:DUF1028 domain-containing protein [Bacteroidota bacterium]